MDPKISRGEVDFARTGRWRVPADLAWARCGTRQHVKDRRRSEPGTLHPIRPAHEFRNHAVKMQLHFTIQHATHSFDQTAWLVVLAATPDDFLELHSGRDRHGLLVDDLVAGVEFRDNEVARCTEG